jgi:hypothetical protein
MKEGEIKYPNAVEEGVTPEMEQARKLGLLEPMEDTLEWLDIKADIHLKYNDKKARLLKEQSQADHIIGEDNDDAGSLHDLRVGTNLESEFATDRGLVEVRRLSETNLAMIKEITDMMSGYDIELFRTPNFIKLTTLREAVITASQKDPEINNRVKAKERIREILELEKQVAELLVIFGQEVQDIISKQ